MSASIKTVFLIDDDPMSNMIHQSLLRKHDWQATTVGFGNGPAALQALQAAVVDQVSSFPDVILLDMEMPAYDGWDFCTGTPGCRNVSRTVACCICFPPASTRTTSGRRRRIHL
jgi:DNA-binding response OmpR family regulator